MSKQLIYLFSFVLMLGLASNAYAELVIHWSLDESSGTTVFDSVGDNHGTLIGNAAWNLTGGVFGGAVLFEVPTTASASRPQPDRFRSATIRSH